DPAFSNSTWWTRYHDFCRLADIPLRWNSFFSKPTCPEGHDEWSAYEYGLQHYRSRCNRHLLIRTNWCNCSIQYVGGRTGSRPARENIVRILSCRCCVLQRGVFNVVARPL